MFVINISKLLSVALCLGLIPEAFAQSLNLEKTSQGPNLKIKGAAGQEVRLERSTSLGVSAIWSPIFGGALTNAEQSFLDVSASNSATVFYRGVYSDSALARPSADLFRLLDHTGKSHQLVYQETNRAVALIFADSGCSNFSELLSQAKALQSRFAGQKTGLFVVNGDPLAVRSTVSNLVQSAGGSAVPILEDPAQMVAVTYGVRSSGEAVLLDPATWTIVYQGVLEGSSSVSGAKQSFLADALANFLGSRSVNPFYVGGAEQCDLGAVNPSISYSRDIAPILQDHCVRCHSPGNIAPWAMTNYSIVKAYAQSIEHEVMDGQMPPWHADPNYGVFTNDFSLSVTQKSKLIQWIKMGAPRGEGPDPLTNVPEPLPDWPLGQPDYILKIPAQSIPASTPTGGHPYQYIQLKSPMSTNAWIKAAVVKPGTPEVVHHVLVFLGTPTAANLIDGFFAHYVPGYEAATFPAGTGKLLPGDSVITLQMHYTPSGKPETDATELGLYLHKEKPPLEVRTRAAYSLLFNIPPRVTDHAAGGSLTVNRRSLIYEFSPHMHYRGSRMKFDALYPNGSRETLLSVPNYHFHWQALYRLTQPKEVPAGTIIIVTGAFDNSVLNPYNPNPNINVTFGEQTYQEMFIGYIGLAELP